MAQLLTGGQVIAKSLKQAGVEVVFGIGGHGNQGLLDAFIDEGIRHITVHHEMVAGAAASGYFKATHRPGVASLTCGPGMATAIPTLVHAAIDCSAVVAVSGDAPMMLWERGASEELDIKAAGDQSMLYRPFAKRVYEVTAAERAGHMIANAFNCATTGRPGVVLVSVPFDLQSELVMTEVPDMARSRPTAKPTAPAEDILRVVEMLLAAKNPVIVAGGGAAISGAWDEVTELAERLDAAVVTSSAGKSAMSCAHPLYAAQCGRDGPPFSSGITREADVVLSVGMRFEEYETSVWKPGVTFSIPPTKLIQVDIDAREIGKNYPVELGLVGDVRTVLKDVLKAMEGRGRTAGSRGTAKRIAQLKQDWLSKIEPQANSDDVPINPHRLMKELKAVFPKNACLVVEANTARPLSLQHYIPVDKGNFFCGQGFQLIGNSPAQALGVKVGRPKQPVIALVGDGSLLLTNQVIPTAVEYEIPIIWIVMNNFGYRAVWAVQQKWFKRSMGAEFAMERTGELYSPDYAMMAEAFGARGEKVERPEKIRPALEKALASGKPYVIDIRVTTKVDFAQLVSTESYWDFVWPTWKRGK